MTVRGLSISCKYGRLLCYASREQTTGMINAVVKKEHFKKAKMHCSPTAATIQMLTFSILSDGTLC
jgi:hypothetical protein